MNTKFSFHVLDRALSTKRPHGDPSTQEFSDWLANQLPGCRIDAVGNIHFTTGRERTLFCAHVDTVHETGGTNRLQKDALYWRAHDAPLGADDGAGVALLMHMIRAGVPGHYLFTQGEEQGCIGSGELVQSEGDLLRGFDRAIAFDRKGTSSVITHQRGQRCCSDNFATHLAAQLNVSGMGLALKPDATGSYTDTGEFTHLIGECTNVSIGYAYAHSDNEYLDLVHFEAMCHAAVRVDWESLPKVRTQMIAESVIDAWAYPHSADTAGTTAEKNARSWS